MKPALALYALFASACLLPVKTTLPACPGVGQRAPGWADYFPESTFDEKPERHNDLTLKWYGGELAAMNEPVLSCSRPADAEVYRFLLASSWRETWAVRVERAADGAELQATKLDGKRPKERRVRHVARADWERVVAAVLAANFWSLPSWERPIGLDGEEWVVEGLRGGAYHAVERWEPRQDNPFRAIGALLLDLADLGPWIAEPPLQLKLIKPVNPEDLGP